MDGSSTSNEEHGLRWLLAEITYKCPLQCPYCSNPVDFAMQKGELTTEEWKSVLKQGREMGAVQLGFSGGEPLVRTDLEELVEYGHQLGYYTNLITSTMGLNEERLKRLKAVGLDTIQVSFQAGKEQVNDFLAGTHAYQHKVEMAKLIKNYGFSLVFNIVITRYNIDDIEHILSMAMDLDADYVELANTQYYGFALENRAQLMPTREQIDAALVIAKKYQDQYRGEKQIYFVVPDYFENRPKPCMNGWAKLFVTVTPNGVVLPCHAARVIKTLEFPSVKDHALEWIWNDSPAFNAFRGYGWMKEPCRSCPEREKDFGGCRCQAYMLTGDATMADPVCDLSPDHSVVLKAVEEGRRTKLNEFPLVFRNTKNSKNLSGGDGK